MQDNNSTKNNETQKRENPFFLPYGTPHYTVPFHRIQLGDYEEAFMEGIRRDDEATDKIINDPAEPTFENTIARVDTEKGETLLRSPESCFQCILLHDECRNLR